MNIENKEYKEIIMEVGYPIVSEDDLEFSREDIEDLMIFPAMREFFIWFPLTEFQSLQITDSFEVDFPDDKTFGIVDARINSNISGGSLTASPFINELLITQRMESSRMYGTRNDYGMMEARRMQKSYAQTAQNSIRARDIRVDEQNKKVFGYSTIQGELVITWAKYSDNFNDIPYRRKQEVIDLAKANVLRAFGMLRGQLDTDTGVSFNEGDMISRADDLEQKVLDKWRGMTKVVVIRK